MQVHVENCCQWLQLFLMAMHIALSHSQLIRTRLSLCIKPSATVRICCLKTTRYSSHMKPALYIITLHIHSMHTSLGLNTCKELPMCPNSNELPNRKCCLKLFCVCMAQVSLAPGRLHHRLASDLCLSR
jgi:hypothetical protein